MASMSFSLPKAALDQLKGFITLCRSKPEVLHNPELTFFSEYLLTMGATLPPKPEEVEKEQQKEEPKGAAKEQEPEAAMEVESEESDVELDMEGVIGDTSQDESHEMGDASKKEMTDQEMESFDEKRSEAMQSFSEGEWDKAVGLFTEAIKLNPNSAAMFAKRGTCFLKLSPPAPKACVRDCCRAIELNPDNAAAYKFRGRANRLLGNFTEAAKDLSTACKIDFDEQADEWLKEVQPNAKKLAEHNRKKERTAAEKDLKERQDRVKKAKEAREKAAKEQQDQEPDMGGMGGGMGGMGGMGGLGGLLNDPEMMAAFSDPEVATAFKDISSNPANIMKYQNNPKVMALVTKMASKMGGPGGMPGMGGGMGGFPGMGGMGGLGGMFGGMGGGPSAGAAPTPPPTGAPKPPTSTDDLD